MQVPVWQRRRWWQQGHSELPLRNKTKGEAWILLPDSEYSVNNDHSVITRALLQRSGSESVSPLLPDGVLSL